MNNIKRRARDGSLENVRDSVKESDYFDKVDDDAYSEAAGSYGKASLRMSKKSSRGNLSEGGGFNSSKRSNKRKVRGSNRDEDIEEQAISESTDMFQIDRLLQNFDPNDFLIPPSTQELIYFFFLKFRANLPMYTTITVIYGIGITYFFTYLLPLIDVEYNDEYRFLPQDSSKVNFALMSQFYRS